MSMIVHGDPKTKIFVYALGKGNVIVQRDDCRLLFGAQQIDELISALQAVKQEITCNA